MPNKPKTPIRSVRVPEALWREFQALAAERGETPSEVLRECIAEYVERYSPPPPPRRGRR